MGGVGRAGAAGAGVNAARGARQKFITLEYVARSEAVLSSSQRVTR